MPNAPQGHRSALITDLLEAGWSVSEREDGRLVVPLEGRGAFVQAALEVGPSGDVRASVDLMRCAVLAPFSREAIASVLLAISGTARWARAVLSADGEATCAQLEVVIDSAFNGSGPVALIERALPCLESSVSLCRREVALLQNERLARAYLVIQEAVSGDVEPFLATSFQTTCQ
jgi:hypothetical protein